MFIFGSKLMFVSFSLILFSSFVPSFSSFFCSSILFVFVPSKKFWQRFPLKRWIEIFMMAMRKSGRSKKNNESPRSLDSAPKHGGTPTLSTPKGLPAVCANDTWSPRRRVEGGGGAG
jgi:hypothetical protein